MTEYCEICGDELQEDELEEGICKRCQKANEMNENYVRDESYIDPGIT
jgi:hypothetical protein